MNNKQLPNSWLYSESFLKRAFAIWGHYFVANLIISIPFMILAFLFALTLATAFPGLMEAPVENPYLNEQGSL